MYLSRNGVSLYYEFHGKGEPTLLFVHGWLTNADIWKYQVAEFSRRYRTLAIDLRGFGRSDKPKEEYTFDLFAEDIDFLLKGLHVEKPVFIGWSKGVSIGLVFAANHPERLTKLILVGGGPKFISSDDFEPGLPPDEFQKMLDLMHSDFDKGVWEFINAEIPESGMDDLKEWIFSLSKQTTPEVALNSIINDSRYDLRPLLGTIMTPTLVCFGELDVICPPGANKVMHDGLKNSEIYEFPGVGHFPFLTAPINFNARLREFLQE